MAVKNILNKTLKLSGLALLVLSLNSCSSKKGLVEDYLSAIKNGDADAAKTYCSKKRVNSVNWNFAVRMLKHEYNDVAAIHSYIPYEGEDKENIYWIEHSNGFYRYVELIKENGEWKIDDIGHRFRP